MSHHITGPFILYSVCLIFVNSLCMYVIEKLTKKDTATAIFVVMISY